jgi:flagellar biosynthesis protein FlhB
MAEDDSTDESQKTEEPTARKLEDARKRGQVVNSKEVNNWLVLFAATLIIVMGGPVILTNIKEALVVFIARPDAMPVDPGALRSLIIDTVFEIGKIILLPLLAIIAAGAFAGFAQTGVLFTAEPLKPDLSKISIMKGFSRLFSGKSIVELIKGLLKLGIVGAAGTMALMPYMDGVEHFTGQDLGQAMDDMNFMFLKMMIAALSVLFIIAVLDYMYQRHSFMQQMRMSKQEMKEEYKQTEGDPHVKAKLRQIREQKARQRMMQAVPEADVVITNPTHFAVALKYDPKSMGAPQMVAKGADNIAAKIKDVAKENKVPVVENAPLARALYDSMEIDQTIPAEHWKAVAEVISYVFKLKGKRM